MKRIYSHEQAGNPLLVLRRAGYSPFRDPQSGEESFVLRTGAGFYPRFHLYVENVKGGISFNLHLDQKKASYGSGPAHAGEYEGQAVEREMARIDGWVKAAERETKIPPAEDESSHIKKHSWWRRLFFGG